MTTEEARKKLIKLKPYLTGCSLNTARLGQVAIGASLYLPKMKRERFERLLFTDFKCGSVISEETPPIDNDAVILYLHGGGYVAGGIDYARGFASVLAEMTGLKVYFPAYRLAPENKCPAALKDCLSTYRYLIKQVKIDPKRIILCGESAGGGLVYSLSARLREMKLPLPGGIIAISPWTDLTMSGDSYEFNKDKDPSMTKERLQFFADCYTDNKTDPLCSPLFDELHGLPPSLIISGGDEIMLSDSVLIAEKLNASGSDARHVISDGLWHAFPLYRLSDREEDDNLITEFIKECLNNEEKPPLDEA